MSDKNLRLRVSLSAIDKITRPFKSMLASNKTLAASIKTTKDQLKQLNGQAAKIEGFRQNKAAVDRAAQALTAARDKARQLATELKTAQRPQLSRRESLSVRVKRPQNSSKSTMTYVPHSTPSVPPYKAAALPLIDWDKHSEPLKPASPAPPPRWPHNNVG